MDTLTLNADQCELVISEGLYDRLFAHLFPGDGDEHGAVIAAGLAQTADGRLRLLARELHLAQDGQDFVAGKRGYKMFRAEFVRDRAVACQEQKLVYLNIHNHGGTTQVQFSHDDLRSHERGYPALLDIAGDLPLGALVFSTQAVAGDIWLPGGRRLTLQRTVIVGKRRQLLFPAPPPRPKNACRLYDRQTRLFGDAGQQRLSQAKIAIIGVGGVGALLIEWLARLGVGHFVLIEPERIEVSNLPRFPGATGFDALVWLQGDRFPAWVRRLAGRLSARKLRIARRVIRRANPNARIELLPHDFLAQGIASRVLDCDYLFLAADTMRARLLFNAIVHQYLIPGVQVGAKVTADRSTGDITSIHAVARPVTPECGCLLCNQLINPSKLQEEGQSVAERRAQQYVDDEAIAAPSVITLNARAASQAADDFMLYLTGLTAKDATSGYMRFMPLTREVFLDEPRRSANCSECGDDPHSRRGRGDLGPRLPTFYGPSAPRVRTANGLWPRIRQRWA
jgi:hypothetical protein